MGKLTDLYPSDAWQGALCDEVMETVEDINTKLAATFFLALVAGGKSFNGRMSSQAQAALPLPGVRALILLGIPLHPAGRPSDERANQLFEVKIPMLFLQGRRDALADTGTVQALVERLGTRATLKLFQEANHSFHVAVRTGRTDAEVRRLARHHSARVTGVDASGITP